MKRGMERSQGGVVGQAVLPGALDVFLAHAARFAGTPVSNRRGNNPFGRFVVLLGTEKEVLDLDRGQVLKLGGRDAEGLADEDTEDLVDGATTARAFEFAKGVATQAELGEEFVGGLVTSAGAPSVSRGGVEGSALASAILAITSSIWASTIRPTSSLSTSGWATRIMR